jgi:hypothetical protein
MPYGRKTGDMKMVERERIDGVAWYVQKRSAQGSHTQSYFKT